MLRKHILGEKKYYVFQELKKRVLPLRRIANNKAKVFMDWHAKIIFCINDPDWS